MGFMVSCSPSHASTPVEVDSKVVAPLVAPIPLRMPSIRVPELVRANLAQPVPAEFTQSLSQVSVVNGDPLCRALIRRALPSQDLPGTSMESPSQSLRYHLAQVLAHLFFLIFLI